MTLAVLTFRMILSVVYVYDSMVKWSALVALPQRAAAASSGCIGRGVQLLFARVRMSPASQIPPRGRGPGARPRPRCRSRCVWPPPCRYKSNYWVATLSPGAIAGTMNAIWITVMNMVYGMVAVKMNDEENHRTETEHEDALIIKCAC